MLQKNRTERVYKRRFIIGIGSHVYGGRKPHDLLFASWRSRRASGDVQSEFQGLEMRRVNGINHSLSLKVQKAGALMSKVRRTGVSRFTQRISSAFLCLFVPSALRVLDDGHPYGWRQPSFCLLTQILMFPRNTLPDTLRNNVLPAVLISLRPVKLTHKINHHKS